MTDLQHVVAVLFDLYGQVDQAGQAGTYVNSPSMAEAMRHAEAILNEHGPLAGVTMTDQQESMPMEPRPEAVAADLYFAGLRLMGFAFEPQAEQEACRMLAEHFQTVRQEGFAQGRAEERERCADMAERWGCLDHREPEAALRRLAATIRRGAA